MGILKCAFLVAGKVLREVVDMNLKSNKPSGESGQTAWRRAVAPYQRPQLERSIAQLGNSLIPYILLWVLMVYSLRVSYWLTLALAIPAAGFMVRIFIIFHDCGHASFFRSQKANDVVGNLTGLLTFTPYAHWKRDHAVHHATASDLDRRGVGDVKVMTVEEYLALSKWGRLGYRFLRNPLVMFAFGPMMVFLVGHRFARRGAGGRERASVMWTNLALAGIVGAMSVTIGLKAYLMVQLPIVILGTSMGVWLFYIQHQFEGVYWARHEDWDFLSAGLKGASFYKLPPLLQWFTGNIGYHHIHHLSPRIPNYRLQKCHEASPLFRQVKPLSLRASLKSLGYRLYDEEHRQMVGYGYLKELAPMEA